MGVYYNYDDAGERNLKLTGGTINVTQNGMQVNVPVLDQQTLYASALVTVNDKGYTKHYFEEGKRICSKIGNGGLTNVTAPVTPINGDYTKLLSNLKTNVIGSFSICIGAKPYLQTQDLYQKIIQPNINQTSPTEPSFYYHSDHLGSSSYITGDNGQKTQTLAYMPYGEDWVDLKHNSPSYTTPYKFTGKEKDQETGYNYYGARYYYDYLSIFLSTDPLSDKYPSTSSYAYCRNNPIMLIDPNGMNDNPVYSSKGIFRGNTTEGFTGEVIIYNGEDDFSKMEAFELLSNNSAKSFDAVKSELSPEAKSNIWTDIAKHFEGMKVNDETFSMKDLEGEKINFKNSESNWHSQGFGKGSIDGSGIYEYETTVENVASSVITHEWYSHIKKGVGDKTRNHSKAYENVINFKELWDKTTDIYKASVEDKLNYYKKRETKQQTTNNY